MTDSTNRPTLTAREEELLPILARGATLQAAADQMCWSYKTAEHYRTRLFKKFGVRNAVELALAAVRHGFVELL